MRGRSARDHGVDHVDLRVGDVARCRPFYDAFLLFEDPDGNRLEVVYR